MQAAQGREKFDLLLAGGTVVDVATGELRPADVGIVGGLIASVHPTGSRADAAEVHNLAGLFLAPGFIDSHVHFESSHMGPADYASVVVAHGTTTAVTGVLSASPRMEGIVAAGLVSGKNVNGHARDLAGAGLQAYAAAGVTSDHEIMTGDDLLAKLWPSDPQIETLRAAFAQESNPARRTELATAIQRQAYESVAYIPGGEVLTTSAIGERVRGAPDAPMALFWNATV